MKLLNKCGNLWCTANSYWVMQAEYAAIIGQSFVSVCVTWENSTYICHIICSLNHQALASIQFYKADLHISCNNEEGCFEWRRHHSPSVLSSLLAFVAQRHYAIVAYASVEVVWSLGFGVHFVFSHQELEHALLGAAEGHPVQSQGAGRSKLGGGGVGGHGVADYKQKQDMFPPRYFTVSCLF